MSNQKISIIITVNGDEKLLIKTLDSINKQSKTNVNNNLEIVVVNMGNVLNLENLSSSYSNIAVVHNQDDNIAVAYSEGVVRSTGEFVAFLSSGDTVSANFLSDCIRALNKHPEANFAAVKAFCNNPVFERAKKNLLNFFRFDKSRIIDLKNEPQFIHPTIHAALFRREAIKNGKFNTDLRYEASMDFAMRLQLREPRYVTAKKAEYYYFMPQEDDFLYHVPANDKNWYTKSFENFLLPILNDSVQKNGHIPEFIQFLSMYCVQARYLSNMNNRNKNNMTKDELQEFFDITKEVLLHVRDHVILNKNRNPSLVYVAEIGQMFCSIKYGDNELAFTLSEGLHEAYISLNNVHLATLDTQRVNINVMDYSDGKILIDGSFREILNSLNVKFFIKFNDKTYELKDNDRYSLTKFFGISAYRKFTFHIELPLDETRKKQTIKFYAKIRNTVVPINLGFGSHWAKLAVYPSLSYWHFNKYIARYEKMSVVIRKYSLPRLLSFEAQLLPRALVYSRKGFLLRVAYYLTRPLFLRKKIWIMYDKLYKGGDSSEYMYRYTAKNNDGITKYYIIDKNTPEYKQLKKDGFKPVATKSIKHILAFLNADLITNTNANVFPFNGYSVDLSRFIRGFCNFGSVCLQHGLSVQKCAMAQQRIVDNTKLYTLASHYEMDNLNKHVYNYEGFDILKLTGIARYDGLVSNDKKQILISPTWRMYNALPVKSSEGKQRNYNPEFKNTVYFKIYNDLINNEKLISTAKKCGYKIKYLLHPIVSAQSVDYTSNSEVEVIPSVGDLSYEKILTESSLMVTDYSGVQFDFAYMRKPLVYFHPNALPAHYEDGCFFYDTMGFGEICKESDELINLLCEYMENGCKMKPEYLKRVEEFYEFGDQGNRQRIYDELLKLQEQIDKDKLRIK
ncbi:MAG: CDP-glycerol glycerophosphotransferase family protein [Bacillota bacterium]|nr:CDP-glycerol glycerophosphotransferase family protein [Bacillota bacterium]